MLIPMVAAVVMSSKYKTVQDILDTVPENSDKSNANMSYDKSIYSAELKNVDLAFDTIRCKEIEVINKTVRDYLNFLSMPGFNPEDIGWDEESFNDCKDVVSMKDKSALLNRLLGWDCYLETIPSEKTNAKFVSRDSVNVASDNLKNIGLYIKYYKQKIEIYDELLKKVVKRNKSLIGECKSYKGLSQKKKEYIKETEIVFDRLCDLLFTEFLLEDGTVNPEMVEIIKADVIDMASIEDEFIDEDGKIDDRIDIRKKTEVFKADFNLKILCDPDGKENTLYLLAKKNDSKWSDVDPDSDLQDRKCCRKFDYSEQAYAILKEYIEEQIDDSGYNSCTIYYAGEKKNYSKLKKTIENEKISVSFIGNYSQFYR